MLLDPYTFGREGEVLERLLQNVLGQEGKLFVFFEEDVFNAVSRKDRLLRAVMLLDGISAEGAIKELQNYISAAMIFETENLEFSSPWPNGTKKWSSEAGKILSKEFLIKKASEKELFILISWLVYEVKDSMIYYSEFNKKIKTIMDGW
jgi:hypothetical protein